MYLLDSRPPIPDFSRTVEGRLRGNDNESKESASYKIDESKFASFLYTSDLPDPDMIIRTGGERRLSGFLPWQSVYSELYFTDKYWPDFDEREFELALKEYGNRQRRFGK